MPAFIQINGTAHQVPSHIGGTSRTDQSFMTLQAQIRDLVVGGGAGVRTFEVVKGDRPADLVVSTEAVATAVAWFVDEDDMPEVEVTTSDFRR